MVSHRKPQSVPRLRVQIHELNTNPMLSKGSLRNCSLWGSFWTQRLQSMKPPKSSVKATFLPRSCQSGRLLNYDPDAKCLQVRQWNISISHLRRKQLNYPWMSELCFCSLMFVAFLEMFSCWVNTFIYLVAHCCTTKPLLRCASPTGQPILFGCQEHVMRMEVMRMEKALFNETWNMSVSECGWIWIRYSSLIVCSTEDQSIVCMLAFVWIIVSMATIDE